VFAKEATNGKINEKDYHDLKDRFVGHLRSIGVDEGIISKMQLGFEIGGIRVN
jgi:hypothetical protein